MISKVLQHRAESTLIREMKEDKYLNVLKDIAKKPEEKEQEYIAEQEPKVKIPVEHPGVLEVPEGKNVDDLGFDHFKSLAKKKGYGKIAKALTNLIVWNKEKNPTLSKWADSMQNKLQAWHEKESE